MNVTFYSGLVYALGFVGIVALGVIPVRSWFVLRRSFSNRRGVSKIEKFLKSLLVLAIGATMLADLKIAVRVFKCLTETYCGPAIASGWSYLAILGLWYLVFEMSVFFIQKFISRTGHTQVPKNLF